MKLYKGKSIEDLRSVKLIDLIAESYRQNTKYMVKVDSFSDKSSSWIEIIKENDNESKSLVFQFNYDGTKIIDTQLHVTPIKKILLEDESRKVF